MFFDIHHHQDISTPQLVKVIFDSRHVIPSAKTNFGINSIN